MSQGGWKSLLLPLHTEEILWETFHENTKNTRHQHTVSEKDLLSHTDRFYGSLPFEGYPVTELPTSLASVTTSLGEAIAKRFSSLALRCCPLSLEVVATILQSAYGITRYNIGTVFPRPFRAVPSAGALYPLEIFIYNGNIEGLELGFYHYNPIAKSLRLVRKGVYTNDIQGALMQGHVASNASLMLFITALFERSTFKYGDRGYRYCLIEAGHVAQNLNLIANSLGLGCMNIGGFIDRSIDELLRLDGVLQSTVYIVAIGANAE